MKKLVSVCVFLLALVTGVFAMAREPVYGVLFIPKKEYTLEKGKFRATVPQVQAVSFIDGRTPVNECSGAAKAVNKQLRAYVDKAYQDYQKEGEPGTWVYPMITKNGDNIYSLSWSSRFFTASWMYIWTKHSPFCRIRGSGYHGRILSARRMNVS